MELRLLIQTPSHESAIPLVIDGKRWYISQPLDISQQNQIPDYVCVSYVWGLHRIPDPLASQRNISSHTLPALSAAMRTSPQRAFWIDAFCIPEEQPQRSATLESMGYIYSRAAEVVVVLTDQSMDALRQLSTSHIVLDEHVLKTLEQEDWVQSTWTYQEVVNSRHMVLTCEGDNNIVVSDERFFNRLSFSLYKYKEARSLDFFAYREHFPRLDAFEDLMADHFMGNITERSALQVMSNVDRRVWADPKNYFYSMIGAIHRSPVQRTRDPTISSLSESFMTLCESRNDFSFIYSSAERDKRYGWRPAPVLLPSILPWHSDGEAQRAHRDSEGRLCLDAMLTLRPASYIRDSSKQIIVSWIAQPSLIVEPDATVAEHVFRVLCRIGYTGSKEYIITTAGMFFPQKPSIHEQECIDLLVSTDIRWNFGAPGLVRLRNTDASAGNSGPKFQFIPGVFLGEILAQEAGAVLVEDHAVPRGTETL